VITVEKFKGQFLGYRKADVDKYFQNLHNEEALAKGINKNTVELGASHKKAMKDEIMSLEQTLETYKIEEQQSLEMLSRQLSTVDEIVQRAELRCREIQQVALDKLRIRQDRLRYLQQLMQVVYGDLAGVSTHLDEISEEDYKRTYTAEPASKDVRMLKLSV